MRDFLVTLNRDTPDSLQSQLRRHLVAAILDGRLPSEERLPSCRQLANRLGISRNTVVLAYQALVDEGYLVPRERSGFFVDTAILDHRTEAAIPPATPRTRDNDAFRRKFRKRLSAQAQIVKPSDWQDYRYPFIYGQIDPELFPIAAWRECSREALSVGAIRQWSLDSYSEDDPLLIEEIRTRVLPSRGVQAIAEEILITMGAQNALYLLATLLTNRKTKVGFENPGYVDARNIFDFAGASLISLPVDGEGLIPDGRVTECDYIYVTPSHQSPTTVTMPRHRRRALLDLAESHDFYVIEDDYEAETNYASRPTPALKSLDDGDRVLYVGSVSKNLAPGLRLGYLVGPADLIEEARSLRRLLLRHPPSNNQRVMALFLSAGHYDALIHRLHRTYRARWEAMASALAHHLPDSTRPSSFGGTSFWIAGPPSLDATVLAERALDESIIIEPGAVHFMESQPPTNYFRLGFSSIRAERIAPGIEHIAGLIAALAGA